MDSNVRPFEGVRFYSVKELGEILAIYAEQWSRSTGEFVFRPGDRELFASHLEKISAVNAKAYQAAHGILNKSFSADDIIAALPPKPVASPQGQLREFLRALDFNLFGFQPDPTQDYEKLDKEAREASAYFWDGDYYTPVYGPKEVP